ncbi:hypothetical protein AALP_AA3G115000 [Arabis alpina]|uniref:Uncharacterized protein n=1 Tax=Arabis alpina TaxID=50452 RepID=A0A087H8J9_ARAAL|nr:hypothetical protein AALP_AA3G115000 [Arabis alpina]
MSNWTQEDAKKFESTLESIPKDAPGKCQLIAGAMAKPLEEVITYYDAWRKRVHINHNHPDDDSVWSDEDAAMFNEVAASIPEKVPLRERYEKIAQKMRKSVKDCISYYEAWLAINYGQVALWTLEDKKAFGVRLLLLGMNSYDNDWSLIANRFVKTRTQSRG